MIRRQFPDPVKRWLHQKELGDFINDPDEMIVAACLTISLRDLGRIGFFPEFEDSGVSVVVKLTWLGPEARTFWGVGHDRAAALCDATLKIMDDPGYARWFESSRSLVARPLLN